jgi:hypothetical protein
VHRLPRSFNRHPSSDFGRAFFATISIPSDDHSLIRMTDGSMHRKRWPRPSTDRRRDVTVVLGAASRTIPPPRAGRLSTIATFIASSMATTRRADLRRRCHHSSSSREIALASCQVIRSILDPPPCFFGSLPSDPSSRESPSLGNPYSCCLPYTVIALPFNANQSVRQQSFVASVVRIIIQEEATNIMALPSNSSNTNAPSSSTTLSTSTSNGTGASFKQPPCSLKALVVSAYDLPIREPPHLVQVRVESSTSSSSAQASARTGPPVQRHKDRNSFKFDTSSPLVIVNPSSNDSLEAWYKDGEVVVEVHYQSLPSASSSSLSLSSSSFPSPLRATYPLHLLKINEPTWLILTLDEVNGGAAKKPPVSAAAATDDAASFLSVQPTIRLQLTLQGPYRPEVSALLGLLGLWFGVVEQVEAVGASTLAHISAPLPRIDPKWLLVPAVPGAALAVVAAPIVLGILTLGLPVFLPLLVLLGIFMVALGCGAVVAWSSTPGGRRQIGGVIGPLASQLLQTPVGQQLVYSTGPRPSPVSLAKTVTPTGMHQKLLWSLAIDAIGSCSYLIPLAGESFDVTWAPIQTIFIMAMYDSVAPNLKYVSALEEILPFTDVIPSATMGWLTEFGYPLVLSLISGDDNGGASSFSSARTTVPERTGVAE